MEVVVVDEQANSVSIQNSKKLEEIVSCANRFKENKEKLFKLLRLCRDIFERFSIEPDHLKQFLSASEEFDKAERDIHEYINVYQSECSSENEEFIKKQCNYDEELVTSVKKALGYSTVKETLYAKPCLAVFGQTKAGKSSLVNCILGERIVIQKDTRCTARVTYLSHCATNFVAHTFESVLQKLKLNEKVTEVELELNTTDDRNDPQKVNVEIRLGSTNRILQSGIDIIDSPGLNENIALNNICANIAKTFLPIIIYVIDGRKGVTEEDINDIQCIQTENPELKLIFFVTKLDRNANERKRNPDVDEVDIANKRLENAFEKLKRRNVLSEKASLENCFDFHGASLWTIQECQSKQQPQVVDSTIMKKPLGNLKQQTEEYNLRQFLRFQECIFQFVKDNLDNKMTRSIDTLKMTIEALIEKINNTAGEYLTDREEKLASIKRFKTREKKLYELELNDMNQNLKRVIGDMLDENRTDFLEALKAARYSTSTELGLSKVGPYQRQEIWKQCLDEIRKLLEAELNRHIKSFVVGFMKQRQMSVKGDLKEIVEELAKGPMGLTSFEVMLQNRLLHEYEFYIEYSGDDVHKSSVNATFKNIIRPVKAMIAQFKQPLPEDKLPNSSSWKEIQGRLLLDRLNKEEFVNKVFSVIIEGFTDKHKRFISELTEQRRVLDNRIDVVEEGKKKLRNLSEDLALQFMYLLEMRTKYSSQIFDLSAAERIGGGGQADVYQCGNLVAKVMKIDNKSSKKMCAMEVYFASRLNHPRVLKLEGILLERINNLKQKCTLYYPYLSGKNLKEFIESNKPTKPDRIQYAIEIAEGIRMLHRQAITHRDIKLENILMRPKENGFEAVVADYGFMKHFAWISMSKWGTPLHIAPEMLRREKYDERIDIFSYGILLWFLMTYLMGDSEEYYPEMVQNCRQDVYTLEKLILDGDRPERRDEISEDMWHLIEKCWEDDPEDRPTWNEILDKLKNIK